MKRTSKIPLGWLPYSPIGNQVPGTRFIAFKVPLKESFVEKLKPEDRFTVSILLDQVPEIGLIIDLTQTVRYYNKNEVLDRGVDYVKIAVPGQAVPEQHYVDRFFEVVDYFLDIHKGDGSLIGVHCTHGVNRTGYMLCRYLIQRLGYSCSEAIEAVGTARGHMIEKSHYLNSLLEHTNSVEKKLNRGDLEEPKSKMAKKSSAKAPKKNEAPRTAGKESFGRRGEPYRSPPREMLPPNSRGRSSPGGVRKKPSPITFENRETVNQRGIGRGSPPNRNRAMPSNVRERLQPPLERGPSPQPPHHIRGHTPPRGRSPSHHMRGRSPLPSMRGRSPQPPIRGRSPPPQMRGRSPPPSMRGRSPPPSLRVRSPPLMRGRTPPSSMRGRTPPPTMRDRSPPPMRGRSPPPPTRGRTPPSNVHTRGHPGDIRGRSPPPVTRSRSSPHSRGRTPPPHHRGRSPYPQHRERSPPPVRGRTPPGLVRGRSPTRMHQERAAHGPSSHDRGRSPPPAYMRGHNSPAASHAPIPMRSRTPPHASQIRGHSPQHYQQRGRSPIPVARGRSPGIRDRSPHPALRGRSPPPGPRGRSPHPGPRGRSPHTGPRGRSPPIPPRGPVPVQGRRTPDRQRVSPGRQRGRSPHTARPRSIPRERVEAFPDHGFHSSSDIRDQFPSSRGRSPPNQPRRDPVRGRTPPPSSARRSPGPVRREAPPSDPYYGYRNEYERKQVDSHIKDYPSRYNQTAEYSSGSAPVSSAPYYPEGHDSRRRDKSRSPRRDNPYYSDRRDSRKEPSPSRERRRRKSPVEVKEKSRRSPRDFSNGRDRAVLEERNYPPQNWDINPDPDCREILNEKRSLRDPYPDGNFQDRKRTFIEALPPKNVDLRASLEEEKRRKQSGYSDAYIGDEYGKRPRHDFPEEVYPQDLPPSTAYDFQQPYNPEPFPPVEPRHSGFTEPHFPRKEEVFRKPRGRGMRRGGRGRGR